MKAASLKEIKTELSTLHPEQVLDICMHLAKYKKENKELLTYLLFEAADEQLYIKKVKDFISDEFEEINKSNLYFVKKTLRKIPRITNRYIKYSGSKQTEVELLVFFCKKIKNAGIAVQANTALGNLYQRQIQKIKNAISLLHEDLQFDYSNEIKPLL
jgi:hypothetical protein